MPVLRSTSIPPDALVAHAQFVRSVAFAILRDDADADDVAQETLARGLATGPGDPSARRSWLGAVARNFARMLIRRRLRSESIERRALRADVTASAVDLASRAEAVRAVADAVLALDEPMRTVVLLRHYDGLPPRAIAARIGEPVDTVKKRLHRAHERLRASLATHGRGEASRRRSALAAIAGVRLNGTSATSATAATGGMAMASAAKVAVGAAAVIGLGVGAWLVVGRDRATNDEAPTTSPTTVASTEQAPTQPSRLAPKPGTSAPPSRTPAVTTALPAGWSRRTVGTLSIAMPEAWKQEQHPEPGAMTWSVEDAANQTTAAFGVLPVAVVDKLHGQMKDPVRRPVTVLGRASTWAEVSDKGRTAALVEFQTTDLGTPGVVFVAMANEDNWPAHADTVRTILGLLEVVPVAAVPATASGPLEMPSDAELAALGGKVPGDRVEGRVLRGRTPVRGASVRLLRAGPRVEPTPSAIPETVRTGETDDHGSFSWSGIAPGSYALTVSAPGVGDRLLSIAAVAPPATIPRIVVVFGDSEVAGRAHLRSGAPAADRRIHASVHSRTPLGMPGGSESRTGSDGTYRLGGLTPGDWTVVLPLGDAGDEYADVRSALARVGPGESATLDLGSTAAESEWRGTIRLTSGTPLVSRTATLHVSSVRSANFTQTSLRTDANGRFRQRLPAGSYHASLGGVPREAMFSFSLDVGASDFERDVVVLGVLVQGTLIDARTGRPPRSRETGAQPRVLLRRQNETPDPAREIGFLPDEDGTFRLFGVRPGRYVVYASPAYGDEAEGTSATIDVADRDVAGIALELRAK